MPSSSRPVRTCTAVLVGLVALGAAAAPATALDADDSPVTYEAEGTATSTSGAYPGTWSGTERYAADDDGGLAFDLDGASAVTMPAGLVDVGTRDFSVSFDLRASAPPATTQHMYVLGARSICDDAAEGWFDVELRPSGALRLEFASVPGARTEIVHPSASGDGQWHEVEVRRVGTVVSLLVDGVAATVDTGVNRSILPPHLTVGTSPCAGPANRPSLVGRVDDLRVGLLTAPLVQEQPRGNEVAETTVGENTVSISSTATALGALGGRWQTSTDGGGTWTDLPGETASGTDEVTSTLTRTRTREQYGEQYRMVWVNDVAETTTDEVAWAVHYVEITSQPAGLTVDEGDDATFTVGYESDSAGAQWQTSTDAGSTWVDVPGATADSYTVSVATPEQDGTLVRALVSGSGIDRFSEPATLRVTAAPELATASAPQQLGVRQTGPGEVTITWAPPADEGDAAVTGYGVGYGTSSWGNGEEVGAAVRSRVFTGLAEGDYTATVFALTAAGEGAPARLPFSITAWAPVPSLPVATAPVATAPVASAPVAVRSTGAAAAPVRSSASALPVTGASPTAAAGTGLLTAATGLLLLVGSRRRPAASRARNG